MTHRRKRNPSRSRPPRNRQRPSVHARQAPNHQSQPRVLSPAPSAANKRPRTTKQRATHRTSRDHAPNVVRDSTPHERARSSWRAATADRLAALCLATTRGTFRPRNAITKHRAGARRHRTACGAPPRPQPIEPVPALQRQSRNTELGPGNAARLTKLRLDHNQSNQCRALQRQSRNTELARGNAARLTKLPLDHKQSNQCRPPATPITTPSWRAATPHDLQSSLSTTTNRTSAGPCNAMTKHRAGCGDVARQCWPLQRRDETASWRAAVSRAAVPRGTSMGVAPRVVPLAESHRACAGPLEVRVMVGFQR